MARVLVQNQHTRELISVRKTSHKHNKKDLSRLRLLSSESKHVPLVEFVYLVYLAYLVYFASKLKCVGG